LMRKKKKIRCGVYTPFDIDGWHFDAHPLWLFVGEQNTLPTFSLYTVGWGGREGLGRVGNNFSRWNWQN
jgi:hypothetical protein